MKYFDIVLVKVIVVLSCFIIKWITNNSRRYDRNRDYQWS